MPVLKPKLWTTLHAYSWKQCYSDCVAGIIVGVVALPLAIAFAIASGVSPERGLYTAIIGGFLVSALGGSRVQIGGPTGAFVVVVYGIVQRFGLPGLWMATVLAGILLVIMGFFRFGSAIKFIPYPVIIGFTSGIAVIIFSSQIKDLFGLQMGPVPVGFIEKWRAYAYAFGTSNPYAVGIGLGSIVFMSLWKRVTQRVPGPLLVLLASSILASWLRWPVETIASRFGEIPQAFPVPALPEFRMAMIPELLPVAGTIALLAGIEALLSAVVSDGMIGGRHRSNMELIAQGVANVVTPLFGGIPVTGAIARTATNVNSGGRTPVAGIVHALTLLAIMLVCGQWVGRIPLACLAAILVVVAYHMSEWHSFAMVLRSPKSDVAVLLTTFGLTVFVDLTVAIQAGMGLAIALFMRRMSAVTNVGLITKEFIDEEESDDPNAVGTRQIPRTVEIFEINGPFFFGASYKFTEAMSAIGKTAKIRIIRMRNVLAIDATGLHVLRSEVESAKRHGSHLLLSDVHAQPLVAMEQAGLLEVVGLENVSGNIDDALNRARALLGLPPMPKPASAVPTVARER